MQATFATVVLPQSLTECTCIVTSVPLIFIWRLLEGFFIQGQSQPCYCSTTKKCEHCIPAHKTPETFSK